MSTEITKFAPQNFEELLKFAEMASKTDLVPVQFKNKPFDIVVAGQMGAELGLQLMQALQNIAVINGRPSIWGDALIAIVSAHQDCDDIKEEFDEKTMTAICTVKRKGRSATVGKFSQQDATTSKLWGKSGPWTNYPKRMLQMRARGFACRDAFPDALRGIITREEAEDIPAPVKIPQQDTDIESFKVEFLDLLKMSNKTEEEVIAKADNASDRLIESLEDIYVDEELFTRCLSWLDSVISKNTEVIEGE